jgi:cytochrome P450
MSEELHHVDGSAVQTAERPLPPARPSTPTDLALFRRNALRFMQRVASFGDVTRFRLGGHEFYLVSHPDYVRDVLVTNSKRFVGLRAMSRFMGNGLLTSEGDFHRRQRRLIQPAFHHTRIERYGETMVAFTDRAGSRWRDGETRDIHLEMTELTLAIAGKTLLDVDIEGQEAERVWSSLKTLLESVGEGNSVASLTGGAPTETESFRQSIEVMDKFLYEMIQRRRQSGEVGDDILSMLLVAQDQEGDGSGMTDQQVRDEAITLLTAGHETTANALTWTWYLISQNPGVEERMHAELRSALGDRLPTTQDIPRLTYVEQVFSEGMRAIPPIPIQGRRAVQDHELGGYRIPAGATVLLGQHVVHHDPRWWPNPEVFDPDRWMPEERAKRPKFSYFPFGGGHRLCIGESFAWMEGVLILATLGQRWRMRLSPGHRISPRTRISQRPLHGMPMELSARS